MTIEIADRLVKLRKKYGYSQEELADKLGLSRQAVSKWERAEASPDTDNLICLAKLYGVSLDELLATDEDIDTIVEEQVKTEEKEESSKEDDATKEESIHIHDDHIVINDDGVFVKGKNGSSVSITDDGIKCINKDGKVIHKPVITRAQAVVGALEGTLMLLATVAFFLLGALVNLWSSAWIVFFIPQIICSLIRAIISKRARKFNMPFLATFTFFLVCLMIPALNPTFPALWHPMWVVFLAIPVYYSIVGTIDKALGRRDEDDDDDDDDDDDNIKVKVHIDATKK